MKKYNSDQIESIKIRLSENSNPICFKTKLNELVKNGMTEQEARNYINTTDFDMEIYYEEDYGLFMVEADAVEGTSIFSPYSKEEMEEPDED